MRDSLVRHSRSITSASTLHSTFGTAEDLPIDHDSARILRKKCRKDSLRAELVVLRTTFEGAV
jgi:hypothetical protein